MKKCTFKTFVFFSLSLLLLEEKIVIFLCYNNFLGIEADAITWGIKDLLVDKAVHILWKQNAAANRPTFTRSLPCPGSESQSTRSTKKGSGSSQAATPITEDLTLLLKTRLRHGKISYDEKDVKERKEGWTAPQKMADELLARWKSTINAELSISLNTKTGDHHIVVKDGENDAVNNVKETWQSITSSLPSGPFLPALFRSSNTSPPEDGPDLA